MTISQSGEEPEQYVASFFEPNSNTCDAIKLSDWIKSHVMSFDNISNAKKTVYPDKYGEPIIRNLIQNIKQELISLSVLITYKGWIHAISSLPALIENIGLLRRFEVNSVELAYMVHIIENSLIAIEEDTSKLIIKGGRNSSVYLMSELNNQLNILLESVKRNPYEN